LVARTTAQRAFAPNAEVRAPYEELAWVELGSTTPIGISTLARKILAAADSAPERRVSARAPKAATIASRESGTKRRTKAASPMGRRSPGREP
jgi:hypothetical protein